MMFSGEASGEPERARGLMYLTLARDAAGGAARDQWIIDLHAKALNSASDADRRAAVAMLEGYLRRTQLTFRFQPAWAAAPLNFTGILR